MLEAKNYTLSLDLSSPQLYKYEEFPAGAGLPSATPFNGKVTVTLSVNSSASTAATACLLLNARNLTVDSVTTRTLGGGGAAALCGTGTGQACGELVTYDLVRAEASGERPSSTADLDLMAIRLAGVPALQPGSTVEVTIGYSGIVNAWPHNEIGLYRSAPFVVPNKVQGSAAEQEVLVLTQGAQLGARRILPCYDAPARKAVFQLSVKVSGRRGLLGLLQRVSECVLACCALCCIISFGCCWQAGQPHAL